MTETLMKIVVDCTTGEVQEIPLTPEELTQRDLDIKAAQARQDIEAKEAARIEGLKTSIAAKRTSKVWDAFTQEEADYLSSVGM